MARQSDKMSTRQCNNVAKRRHDNATKRQCDSATKRRHGNGIMQQSGGSKTKIVLLPPLSFSAVPYTRNPQRTQCIRHIHCTHSLALHIAPRNHTLQTVCRKPHNACQHFACRISHCKITRRKPFAAKTMYCKPRTNAPRKIQLVKFSKKPVSAAILSSLTPFSSVS